MDRASPFIGINVFLACSSKDQPYLNQLCIHLKPLEAGGLIRMWDETSILPGARHVTEIERMIEIASVAVLLVTADFLASPEIAKHILPPILEKVRLNTMTIVSVIVGYSAFEDSLLEPYKPINDSARPLKILREGEKEMVWQKVAQRIRAIQQEDQKNNTVVDADQPLNRHLEEVKAMPTHRSEDAEPVLNESSIEQLSDALLNAFPTRADLKLLIAYKLGKNMEIVAAGNNLEEQVHSLVMWAYSQGQMKILITGALARNPGNPKLRKFAMEHGF